MKQITIRLILLCLLLTCSSSRAQIVISGYLANPAGTDSSFEYVQLKATQNINFASTPYAVVFTNNGTATANGWVAGSSLSYGFNLNSGSVNQGDVFYVGGSGKLINGAGSTDISSATWIRTKFTGTTAGDGFGSANSSGSLGNGGTSADGIAVFSGLTSSLTNTTVPIDAIFFGTAVGGANPASGGYTLPNNDRYSTAQGTYGDGTNTWFYGDGVSGSFARFTGTYNVGSNSWTTIRTLTNVALTVSSPLTAINSDITLSGLASPLINVNLTGFNGNFGNAFTGSQSASSSFTVSGTNLVDSLKVVCPTDFEIRTGVDPFSTATIKFLPSGGTVTAQTIDVRFTPITAGAKSENVANTSLSATTVNVPVTGTGITPVLPTNLRVANVNSGGNVFENTAFSITVEAVDGSNNLQNVNTNTTVQITIANGGGSLTGTTSGIISSGNSSVTITGLIYNPAETGVVLQASTSAGMSLTSAISNSFDVLGSATSILLSAQPVTGIVGVTTTSFSASARRNDNTVDAFYTSPCTLSVVSGPGTISGTTIKNFTSGFVNFNDIQFSAVGDYVLQLASGSLTSAVTNTVSILPPPILTELVVPKFFAAKNSSGTNSQRTSFAACFQIDNLLPFTLYDVRTGIVNTTGEVANTYGAGVIWNGTDFSGTDFNGLFFTDNNGSSGPFWIFLQPTANNTNSRFEPGIDHKIRIGYRVNGGGSMPSTPQLETSKTLKALDINTTARTVTTSDDGAYIKGTANGCAEGKYVLLYDNISGTGDPLFSYQVRNTTPTTIASSTTQMPTAIADVYTQTGTSVAGDYAAVIPIGANNPNGVRRIESRNADNTVFGFSTDADGVWPSGANTLTNARRSVTVITKVDAPLVSISTAAASITIDDADSEICVGSNITLTVVGGSLGLNADWYWYDGTCGGTPFAFGNSVTFTPSAGNKTYFVRAQGCDTTTCTSINVIVRASAPTATVQSLTAPASACAGNTINVSVPLVANASYYNWSGPSGTTFNGQASPVQLNTNTPTVTLGNPLSSGWSLCVQAENACGTTINTKCVFVRGTLTTPGTINGNSIACANTSGNYNVTAVAGADNYNWAITGDATISGSGNAITVNFGPSFTTGILSVNAGLNCGTQSGVRTMTISNSTILPGTIAGAATVCPGGTATYSIAAVVGASSYNWTACLGATVVNNGTSADITFPATFSHCVISVSANSVCGTASALRSRAIAPATVAVPANIIGANENLCNSNNVSYSCAAVAGATSYTWSVVNGSIATGQNTSSITVDWASGLTGTLSVVANNGCGSSGIRSINVRLIPGVPSAITTNQNVTTGAIENASINALGAGVTYNWSSNPAGISVVGQGNSNVQLDYASASPGVYTIYCVPSNACGNSNTRTINVTVVPARKQTAIGASSTLVAYPNPVSNVVNILFDADTQSEGTLNITDVSGRILLNQPINSIAGRNQLAIDMTKFAQGVYFIQLIEKNKVTIQTITKL